MNEFKEIEQIVSKYIPFPAGSELVEVLPDGFKIRENGKTYRIKVSEHIPNKQRGKDKKVSN